MSPDLVVTQISTVQQQLNWYRRLRSTPPILHVIHIVMQLLVARFQLLHPSSGLLCHLTFSRRLLSLSFVNDLCPVYTRTLFVATCIHLSSSACFLYRRQNCRQSVARQMDASRPWHKWIMNSRQDTVYVSRTSKLYPATCIRRHICIHVARPGYMFSGRHILSWWKRGIKTHLFRKSFLMYYIITVLFWWPRCRGLRSVTLAILAIANHFSVTLTVNDDDNRI